MPKGLGMSFYYEDKMFEDCGFRDDFEADRWRGICPTCGDSISQRKCHCNCNEPEEQPLDQTEFNPDIPF